MTRSAKKIRLVLLWALLLGSLAGGTFASLHSREKTSAGTKPAPAVATTRPAVPETQKRSALAAGGAPASSLAGTQLLPSASDTPRSRALPRHSGAGADVFLKNPDGNANEESSAGGAKIFFANGDLFDLYGGGRDFVQSDAKSARERDSRIWIDARAPWQISSRLKLYGVSTLTFGDAEIFNSVDDYRRSYGVGGGFGFSYLISPDAELNFDFRRARPLESRNDDSESTDSAGVSLKVRF